MTKTNIHKWVAILISFLMIGTLFSMLSITNLTASAISCQKDGFDKSRYTLSGNMAEDVATIAKSQKGRTGAQLGYTEPWCDEYVADCIENAGADSSIVGHGGTVADFEAVMRKKGAVEVSSPQVGDLVFFTYSHVEIVTKVENGTVYCAGGNNGGTGNYKTNYCAGERKLYATARLYLRPNYKANPKPTTVLNVETGNSSTETTFNWNYVEGATEYDIKIWKGTLWDGDAYHIEWGVTSNSWKIILPAGVYQAYIDVRYGDDISMSNTVEFAVKDGCKLDVVAGNASTETIFSWNTVSNASQYDLKVWKNKLWEGDPVFIEWNASNSYSKILSEGTYYAYVDARFGDDIVMSNVVEFTVKNGCKLTVDVGTSSIESVFSWNKLDNINEYDIKVWKNKLWEGDPVFVEWNASNSYSKLLPAGTYYAYVDARGTDSQIFMSNVVEFTITNGGKLKVDVGDSATKTVFSWNDVPNSTRYEIKIWNGTYWVGDAYHIEWSIPKTNFSIVLPVGHYEAYLDTVVNDDIIMSNIVKFDITEGTPIPGDLNQDGTLSLTDLIPLQQSLLRQTTLTADQAQLADYNGDGSINVLDLMLLKRAL
ncbi:MAG: dockerin type I domain-containing protein, partial [Ruminococcus sp.]|nr:dockerin type I domain-containing protein [Ruminococcus sp.]